MLRTHGDTVISARVGELWLFVMPDQPIDDATWRAHLEVCADEVERNGPYPGVLGWAPKAGPSAGQRRIMTVEYGSRIRINRQRRFALVTESAFVRGIMTALRWVAAGTEMNAFAPDDVSRAFDWLAEDVRFDRNRAEDALHTLRIQSASSRTTDL